jgi:hypothetical protein
MAINLIRRIAPNPFDRGPDLMQLPILRFGNAGTLCWRARLDGLSSFAYKSPVGLAKIQTWNHIADSPI